MWQIILILSAAIASFFIPTPQEMKNAFTSGQNFYASRDYKKALQQYELILNTESPFMEEDSVVVSILNNEFRVTVRTAAKYQKANALKNLGFIDSALTIFSEVARHKKETAIAALAQFQVYDILYKLRRFDESIQAAYDLTLNFPEDTKAEQALYDVGWAYRELNNLDSSNYAFTRLIKTYPNTSYFARALYQLAQNNYDQGNYETAIEDWKILIEKYRPSIFTAKDWEKVELKAERERQIFEATNERDVETSDLELVAKAYVKVGDSYVKLKRYDEAIKNYRTIITTYTLLPSLQEICWIKIAETKYLQSGVAEAVDAYKEAIDANFNNKKIQAKMQYKIAELYQNERMFLQAADAFDFYINSFGSTADEIGFGPDKAKLSMIAALYNGKDYERTIAHSDSFLVKYGYSDLTSSVLFLKGSALLTKKEYAPAKVCFTKIIEDYPKSPDVVNSNIQLGFINFKEGNLDLALENYQNIIKNYAGRFDSSEVYYNMLLVYADLKKDQEAIECFDNVKFGSPYYFSAFGKVVKILSNKGEFQKADSLLKYIADKDSKVDSVDYSQYVNFAYADVNIAKKDYQKAIEYLSKVISDSTKDDKDIIKVQSLYARGVLYFSTGANNEAIKDLESVLQNETFKTSFQSMLTNTKEKLALAYSKAGKIDESINLINTFYSNANTAQDSARIKLLIANIYYEAKDYKKAIDIAQPLLSHENLEESIIVGTYIVLANSYKGLNDFTKAASLLVEASEKYPKSEEIPQVLFSLGGLYFDYQDFEKSAEIFTKFTNLYPDHQFKREAMYYTAFSYFQIGKWDKAVSSFKAFINSFPDDKLAPEFQHYIGESYFNEKNFEKAVVEYQTTYRKYPNSEFAAIAMYNEGWCYFQMKNYDKMIETFRRLADRFPNTPYAGNALFTIGDYYYNNRNYPKATESYEFIVKRFPNYERVEEAKALVKELSQINSYLEYEAAMKPFDNGNYEAAIRELNKVIEKYPNDDIVVACRLNIASAYAQLGEQKKAYDMFVELRDKYQNDPNQLEAYLFAKAHVEYIEAKNKLQSSK